MPRKLADPKTKKTGRPSIMTPAVIDKLVQAFALGCTDLEACLYANISRDVLYNYEATYPDFVDRKDRLKQTPILKARQELVKGLKDNPELALKYLERKLKKEFSLRTETTGADGEAIQVSDQAHTQAVLRLAQALENKK